jgi:hypothetical protein
MGKLRPSTARQFLCVSPQIGLGSKELNETGGARDVRVTPSLPHDSRQNRREMVKAAGGNSARILHTHFASLGAADAVFEQEAPDLQTLEKQIHQLTSSPDFQNWSKRMSSLLTQSPKREVYIVNN